MDEQREIIIDYSALNDAKGYLNELGGMFSGVKAYASNLETSINANLSEWVLSAEDPYGHGHVGDAKTHITSKKNALNEDASDWKNRATYLQDFIDYVDDRETVVVGIYSTLASDYVDYSGISGFFDMIGDALYGTFCVNLANTNDFTREFFESGKAFLDDADAWLQDVEDYFQHGDGKYILDIAGTILEVGLAIAGAVAGILAAPFTGGASFVATIAYIGAVAGVVAAVFTTINGIIDVANGMAALNEKDDPGVARTYSDVEGFSDFIAIYDFGGANTNIAMDMVGRKYDEIHTKAELTSVLCSSYSTVFGKKVINEAGIATIEKRKWKFDKTNIGENLKDIFGIKKKYSISETQNVIHENELYTTNIEVDINDLNVADADWNVNSIHDTNITNNKVGFADKKWTNTTTEFQSSYQRDFANVNGVDVFRTNYTETTIIRTETTDFSKALESTNKATSIKSDIATQNLQNWFNLDESQTKVFQNNYFNAVRGMEQASVFVDVLDSEDLGEATHTILEDKIDRLTVSKRVNIVPKVMEKTDEFIKASAHYQQGWNDILGGKYEF